MNKQRVLFLCNQNSARSLMGEALLRHLAGDRFEAVSAGVDPDQPHELALMALAELGIDTQGLASKSLDDYVDQHFDAVIVLCDKAQQRCRQWSGHADEWLFWDIKDPRLYSTKDAYADTLQEIRTRLRLWLSMKARDDDHTV
ncbi:arsenate reductase ArsC [Aidingimonas halophila]|uniref:Protein-tyrosine-phosphatase n=1 Tax=Aidingimonas halophila TaxID=574349 RepID=A0A1H3EWH2_9GAMM|nr:arsenate reductase ArsC [Aidingimonas halophila]GHC31754.1 arsenate reductase [Aidingimonas halophila]SDX82274.1 Protein-tyrosine-phosphatase [Aidingimonas halophila]